MTVLLMVFILLTLLFQMVAAIARMEEGLKVNEAASIQAGNIGNRPGGIFLRFKNTEVVAAANELAEVKSWLTGNKETIKQQGYTLSAIISADQSDTGKKLSLQFSRLLELKKLADELGVDQEQLQIVNRIDAVNTANSGQIQLFVGAP